MKCIFQIMLRGTATCGLVRCPHQQEAPTATWPRLDKQGIVVFYWPQLGPEKQRKLQQRRGMVPGEACMLVVALLWL